MIYVLKLFVMSFVGLFSFGLGCYVVYDTYREYNHDCTLSKWYVIISSLFVISLFSNAARCLLGILYLCPSCFMIITLLLFLIGGVSLREGWIENRRQDRARIYFLFGIMCTGISILAGMFYIMGTQ